MNSLCRKIYWMKRDRSLNLQKMFAFWSALNNCEIEIISFH